MKRISLACALLLFTSLALMAADAPAPVPAPMPELSSPASCSLEDLDLAVLAPAPLLKSFLPSPCYGMAACPDGSSISCFSPAGSSGCMSEPGCWVNCFENGYEYCPGRASAPECWMY